MANPFGTDTNKLSIKHIIDRANELDILHRIALERQSNVLLCGDWGVGKTCLLRKFRHEHLERHESILSIELKMEWLTLDDPLGFLREVNRALIVNTCELVTGYKPEELEQRVAIDGDLKQVLRRNSKWFSDIYLMLRADVTAISVDRSSEFGAALAVNAKTSEKVSKSYSMRRLSAHDLFEASQKLVTGLDKLGLTRVIAFGDEANHLSKGLEIDIFQRHLEEFARWNVQFVFTARPEFLESAPNLRKLFPERLDIKGFATSETVGELLDTYSMLSGIDNLKRMLPEFGIELIWLVTSGNPKQIQRILQECFDEVRNKSTHDLTSHELVAVVSRLFKIDLTQR